MVALRFRILLVVAALVTFGGALWAPFQCDDAAVLRDVWQAGLLTGLTFRANQFLSSTPFGFHLVSLSLHLLAVWLACAVLEELLPLRAARVAAAIFALHPLQTEAVVYVSARGTLMAAVLCLGSMWWWLKGRRWVAVVAFSAALVASAGSATFPLFVGMYEWSTRRRRESVGPLAAMMGVSLVAGWQMAKSVSSVISFDYFSYQGVAILRYLWLLMAPLGLTVDAEVRTAPLAASLAWGVIAVVALLSWRTVRAAQAGFWILGGLALLLPSSSVFPAGALSADHRMYLPLVCFGGLFGLLFQGAGRRMLLACGALLVGISIAQTRVWQSPQSLWMEAARQAPEHVRPKRELARLVPPPQAVELLEEARRLAPEDAGIAAELGLAYQRMGKPELAEAEFRRALTKDPCCFDALWNLKKTGVRIELPPGCSLTPDQGMKLRNSITLAP